ncbi:hypothetical protein D7Y21_11585 [Corallococcus sp. AB045]|nr:hypothetical protein D7Y21_11585 [Corallococcus sp. AB045]
MRRGGGSYFCRGLLRGRALGRLPCALRRGLADVRLQFGRLRTRGGRLGSLGRLFGGRRRGSLRALLGRCRLLGSL